MEIEAEEAAAVRNLQDVVEASSNPDKMAEDGQEPSQSPNGTDNESEESGDNGKNGLSIAKDKVGSKKARTCKSTAHCNTNSCP
jgi:hypothetical protein